jgi:adenosylcobinamide-phosphate synthase
VVTAAMSRTLSRWGAARRPALAAVTAGIVADWLLGEPPASWHPVAGFGRAMIWLEHRWYADSHRRGILHAACGTALAGGAGWLLTSGRPRQRQLALALATYVAVAARALQTEASRVAASLEAGDLDTARARLPALVGRDPAGLGTAEVTRAVVESVAENTVDAVLAPAWWAALAGPGGVLAYRAINTLDAMVGHRSPRYARFGWAAARADDIAGWAPARLTALLVAAVRPRAFPSVLTAVRKQAPAHPSPNAGVAEAAFAAALGVRLGGRNSYDGRVERRPDLGSGASPQVPDITRAVRLSRDVTAAAAIIGLVLWRR